DLKARASEGALLIVEGPRDVESLRRLGVDGKILPVKAYGRSLIDALGEIERRNVEDVILLMDFDRRGREWTGLLTRHLEAMKIKPDLTFWRRLLGLLGRDVKDIEGLAGYLETLTRRTGKNIL
ncbi:MAG: TOPRIM domain-containing protein, partial [Candidatus Bathyarchaeota archaeon B63]